MNQKQTQKLKQSIVKILGIHRSFNYGEPYLIDEESQAGGTGFFVDPKVFGPNFPVKTDNLRFVLTNFHVVEELTSNKCIMKQPSLGNSAISGEVIYVVPKLDVAIIKVDPFGEHDMWFDQPNLPDFLEKIPNLSLDTNNPVKGNSQRITAIGFPNLSGDYQICSGVVSGRGMGMIQLNISFNGGNSGGPLFLKNKVIGICTASISESEALGLAVPIYQVVRFFQLWADYTNVILKTPTWGIMYKTTTPDYLRSKNIEGIQGALVKKIVGSMPIKPKNIIMGIKSGGKAYNIDNYGLLQVDWTDKRVPFDNLEFVISLDPNDIRIQYFDSKRHPNKWTSSLKPKVFNFKVKKVYASWEKVDYIIVGGMVFMNLCFNHLEEEEDEDEITSSLAGQQGVHLSTFINSNLAMKRAVVVTHINPQSHVFNQKNLRPFDRIVKVNNKKVESVDDLRKVVEQTKDFITIQTQSDTHTYCMTSLKKQEMKDSVKLNYPVKKLSLIKKRKHNTI